MNNKIYLLIAILVIVIASVTIHNTCVEYRMVDTSNPELQIKTEYNRDNRPSYYVEYPSINKSFEVSREAYTRLERHIDTNDTTVIQFRKKFFSSEFTFYNYPKDDVIIKTIEPEETEEEIE